MRLPERLRDDASNGKAINNGLQRPLVVKDATVSYLEAEDAIAAWIDECCDRDPQAWESRRALFVSWAAWATKAGEPPGSKKGFVQAIEARGFLPQRKRDGRGFFGLRIVSEATWRAGA
ncbi:MAG TPA: hypothetical protein VF014_08105 [Casimicrobiaceae bacterium]|nr:hypothetical protein [Casimicrobiaceae bacterium]